VSELFDPNLSLVVVYAIVCGPRGNVRCRSAVDTGASGTTISHRVLRSAGYDTSALFDPVKLYTVNGATHAGRLPVELLSCLGHAVSNFQVVCHTVTARTPIDGLLGLDFLRGRILTLDFARGRIALAPPVVGVLAVAP
jgi:predicted aspartyl protease